MNVFVGELRHYVHELLDLKLLVAELSLVQLMYSELEHFIRLLFCDVFGL